LPFDRSSFDEFFLVEHRENRSSCNGCERVASKRRSMRSWRQGALQVFPHEQRAYGKTTSKSLRERYEIAFHAIVFRSEKLPRAPDTRLHFIETQERSVLVAQRA
jgi:hypothetical protein